MSAHANKMALSLPEQTAKETSMNTMFFIGKMWKLNPCKKQNQKTIHNIIVQSVKCN